MTIQRIDPKLCRDAHETRQTFQQVGLSLTSLQNQIDAVVAAPGGAPIDATYITQTPNASLSAEQAMSALGTGLVKNTTATGVQSVVPDSSTVGQVLRVTGASTYGWGALDLADTDAVTGVLADAQMPNLTGDVTTVEGAVATTIANSAVTYAKIQNVSATDKVLGRSSAGAGVVQEIACTAAARSLLDDTSVAAMRQTLFVELGVDVQEYDDDLTAIATNTTAEGFYRKLSTGNVTVHKSNLAAAVDPAAATDDVTLGYSIGSIWINTTLDKIFICTDATDGAAVWRELSDYRPGGTDVAVADGGTGASTAQAAINTLSAVAAATNEHVLTKDTATGNAIFKAAAGGSSLPVVDTTAIVKGSADATKLVAIEADTNVPTATTVTLTAPATSGTLVIGTVGTTDLVVPVANGTGGQTLKASVDGDLQVGAGSSVRAIIPGGAATKKLDLGSTSLELNDVFVGNSLRCSQAAAGTLDEGRRWNDSTQKTIVEYLNSIKHYKVGNLFVATASAAVASSTTETTVIGSGVGTLTLPANYLVAGRTLRFSAWGFFGSTNLGPTLRMRAKLGSTIICPGAATALGLIAASSRFWRCTGLITCRTTGATGTVFAQGMMEMVDLTTAFGAPTFIEMINATTVTLDTTVSQLFDLMATWGTNSASNTITGTNFLLEAIS